MTENRLPRLRNAVAAALFLLALLLAALSGNVPQASAWDEWCDTCKVVATATPRR